MAGYMTSAFLVLVTAVLVVILPAFMRPKVPDDKVFGSCTKQFAEVEQAYRELFRSGLEHGSAMSVYYKGAPVCDMWGGYADERSQRVWKEDTTSCFFSTTKGISALAVMLLHDRGHIDFEKPVATYWPEFAQNGKESITVKTLMSNSAGLAAIDEPFTAEMVKNDPEAVGRALAKQKPHWEPGTGHGYHTVNIGLYMDQLIRHADPKRRSLKQFFEEEIAQPFGIDFSIGASLPEQYRVAYFNIPTAVEGLLSMAEDPVLMYKFIKLLSDKDSLFSKSIKYPELEGSDGGAGSFNWPEFRDVPNGSANGFGTARAVAKLWGILANGGMLGQKRLLSKDAIQKLNTPLSGPAKDITLGFNSTYGYGVSHYFNEDDKNKHRLGTPGYGGQMGCMDATNKFSIAYVTTYARNFMGEGDGRTDSIRQAIYNSL